ncbi:molybdate ABC transporter substrate-binding protein [Caenimonas aquaedulcis]|uniref:Substrate-binding domain-containing protein n=1 Tax=Caenimonas aquaedulcis TaxID=2793270 RepID=A0A931MIM5_9BURK|nr:substrate-binding domain-containing protein [Caenimonas aquaedulcis]MBG9389420.1 substrate-binding domain-containing protein [Caenimonas aquaedulcis]
MSSTIHLLSGGAAQSLVNGLKESFAHGSGVRVHGSFGAVGAMRDKLLAGAPCDVLVLTQALIDQLTKDGHAVPGSAVPLGIVKTGVAVKTGAAAPDVSTAVALKAALEGASAIYFPDPVKATAGIHFLKVMKSLGVDAELEPRFKTFPNGAAAMLALSQDPDRGAIGCTQVTEILYADGVELAGLLPREFELATVYTAAVCTRAQDAKAAGAFIAMMAGNDAAQLRRSGGFEAP